MGYEASLQGGWSVFGLNFYTILNIKSYDVCRFLNVWDDYLHSQIGVELKVEGLSESFKDVLD